MKITSTRSVCGKKLTGRLIIFVNMEAASYDAHQPHRKAKEAVLNLKRQMHLVSNPDKDLCLENTPSML